MKILIAVPSKNRVETLKKYTLSWLRLVNELPDLSDEYDWKIFVEPQDFSKYSELFEASGVDDLSGLLVDIRQNDKGLGYAKNFIMEYALDNGYELVLKLDDDVKGFTKMRVGPKTEEESALNFVWMCNKVVPIFQNHRNLGAVAFPYGNELYDMTDTFTKTKRLQTSYFIKPELFAVNPDINVFEDFATGLNVLVKNFAMLKYNWAGQVLGVKVGGGTGGHQAYDRKVQAYKEVELLRAIYPALKFRKVDKPWEIEPDIKSIKL